MNYSMNGKTEILATTGPTLHTVEQLCRAMSLGVTSFRLALSSRERDVCDYVRNIRDAEKRSGCKAQCHDVRVKT